MKARLKAFWKRFKWVIVSVGGVLLVVLIVLLRILFAKKTPDPVPGDEKPLPPIDERIRERVAQAEEEATVARIEARVRAETDREQLERINQVEDGAERRRRLAAMLRRL